MCSAARIPDEPGNLKHSFVIRSSNITASLSWSAADPSSVVTGYRVVWGHMFQPHGHIMDKTTALTKVLHKVCITVLNFTIFVIVKALLCSFRFACHIFSAEILIASLSLGWPLSLAAIISNVAT